MLRELPQRFVRAKDGSRHGLVKLLAGAVLGLLLTACGGGGETASASPSSGTGTTSSTSSTSTVSIDNSWLTFSHPELAMVAQSGTALNVSFSATSTRQIAPSNRWVIVDTGSITATGGISVVKLGTTGFQASFTIPANLAPRAYQGALKVMLCADTSQDCALAYPESTWSIPYTLTVAANLWGAQAAAPLDFSYPTGGSDSHKVSLVVSGPGKTWTLVSKPDWLDLSAGSGVTPTFLTAAVKSGIGLGKNTGALVLASSTGERVTLPTSLYVTSAASSAGGAGSLNFSMINGTKLTQSVSVNVGTGNTTRWTATSNASWLRVTELSATSPLALELTIDPSVTNLASNQYATKIEFKAPDGTTLSQSVALDLKLPTISSSVDALVVGGENGRSFGASALNFSLNTGVYAHPWRLESSPSWLIPAPSAAMGTNVTSTLTVTPVVAQVLGNPTRAGEIVVAAQVNGDKVTKTIPVGIRLDQRKLLLSETGFMFTYIPPGLSPAVRTVKVLDNFGMSTGWAATSDSPWLKVTPSGVTSASGQGELVLSIDAVNVPWDAMPIDYWRLATVTLTPSDPAVQAPEKLTVGLWYGDPLKTVYTPYTLQLAQQYSSAIADPVRPLVYAHTFAGSDIDIFNVHTRSHVGTYKSVANRASTMAITHDGAALYVLDMGALDPVPGAAPSSITMIALTQASGNPVKRDVIKLATPVGPTEGFGYIRPNGVGMLLLGRNTAYATSNHAAVAAALPSQGGSLLDPEGPTAVSRDGTRAAFAGSRVEAGVRQTSPSLYLLDHAFDKLLARVLWPSGLNRTGALRRQSAAFSSDGTRFVTPMESNGVASSRYFADVWDGVTGAPKGTISSIYPMGFMVNGSADGSFYLPGAPGETEFMARFSTDATQAKQWYGLGPDTLYLTAFVTSANGQIGFATFSNGTVRFVKLD